MEGLRWWLLLLTALMFSMSGCARHITRVGDTIYGKVVGAPAPTVPVLEREGQ